MGKIELEQKALDHKSYRLYAKGQASLIGTAGEYHENDYSVKFLGKDLSDAVGHVNVDIDTADKRVRYNAVFDATKQ